MQNIFRLDTVFSKKIRWGPREGKEGEVNTPRLLPIALAIPRTNFLGPPAVCCGLGLDRDNRDSQDRW